MSITTRKEKSDVFVADITAKIVGQLESGIVPWACPWHVREPFHAVPYNAFSKTRYNGFNIYLLKYQNYDLNGWMTYKQAQQLGAQVRKGEHGTPIGYYEMVTVRDSNSDDPTATRSFPRSRTFIVFNLSQIDNLPASFTDPDFTPCEHTPNELADHLLSQAHIEYRGDVAQFIPSIDKIELPVKTQFKSTEDYYAVALHELAHWSGHKTRLARDQSGGQYSLSYAKEEMIAEMCAAFLCAHVGFPSRTVHADYIGHWLDLINGDSRVLMQAASAAQRAFDFLLANAEQTVTAKVA